MNNRTRKAAINSAAGIFYEIATIIAGLVLPRLILGAFGSKYNGISSSITQFLSFVALLRAGVGGVTKAALYKPLANGDVNRISGIIKATEKFMRRVAFIFLALLVGMACTYPYLVRKEFEWLFTASLVLIIGLSTFAQYYFGITYQMLLEADQQHWVVYVISTFTTILNVITAVLLINNGLGIHAVKLGSSLVFCINPIAINLYVKKKYKLDHSVPADNSAIKQRWDAFAQQVAMMVRDNTDIIVLTVFTNTLEVSVYSVYFLVIKAMNSLLRSFTNGIGGAFGNMIAKNEENLLNKNFRVYELVVYSIAIIMYSCTCLLIVPFVMIYTKGVVDIDYSRPVFGYVLSFAYLFYCIRIPYQTIVEVAGHFRQTKQGAYFEAVLNITSSIFLCWKFGIVGVAIGTLLAMAFRTFQYALYITKAGLIKRGNSVFIKRILVCLSNVIAIIILGQWIPTVKSINYLSWLLNALITGFFALAVTAVFDWLFYRADMRVLVEKIFSLRRRK